MANRVILCIGTKKGLFIAESPKARRRFALRGPFGAGVAVYAALADTRGVPRLYASSCNALFGMKVLRSSNLGKTFKETKSAPAFPKDDGRALANIWSLESGDDRKDLWCGVEPASLFRSGDGGDSWEMVPGSSNPDHPGIGVLRSDDHGHTWRSISKGLPSDFGFPIVVHPHDPDTIYVVPLEPATRTCPGSAPAVWRSENGGGSWKKLAQGLPRKESYFTVLRDALDIDELASPALY